MGVQTVTDHDSEVTAPISGSIGLRLIDVGNIVHPGDVSPLVVITQW